MLPRTRSRGKRHERESATIWALGLLRRWISENGPTHERWRAFHTCVPRHLRKVSPMLPSTMYPSSPPPPSNHNHTTTFHTHMCIAPPSLFPAGAMSALSRHSHAKRKNPDNQEWRTVGASRRSQTVGNQCDEILIGFQPIFSGSHKRPRVVFFGRVWSARQPDAGSQSFFCTTYYANNVCRARTNKTFWASLVCTSTWYRLKYSFCATYYANKVCRALTNITWENVFSNGTFKWRNFQVGIICKPLSQATWYRLKIVFWATYDANI